MVGWGEFSLGQIKKCFLNFYLCRTTTRKRIPNTKIINSAVSCIGKLEKSLEVQNQIYQALLIGNRRLRDKLREMNQLRSDLAAPRPFLFHCEECDPPIEQKDSKAAFLHLTECHPVESTEDQDPPAQKVTKTENVRVKCEECGSSFPDPVSFQIHSLLHQDLVLFLCPVPRCGQLFGAPSKVKQHYLVTHGTLLSTENQLVLNSKARLILTR